MITTDILFEASKSARVLRLTKDQKQLITPTYFPAVSGIRFPVDQIVNLLHTISYPRILVSCYDIFAMKSKRKIRTIQRLSNYRKKGAFVLLDSGVFESYWKVDVRWSFNLYKISIHKIESDFYFSFDVLPNEKRSTKLFLESTYREIRSSSSISNTSECIPILHGTNPKQLISMVEKFVNSFPDISRFIGVAERDCGRSLSERAHTVIKLRQILNKYDSGIGLHILGCGDPLSLAMFAYCGADMFDSLDWSETVIETNELRTHALSHYELLKCQCAACSKSTSQDPITSAFLHNLLFYQDFVINIQNMIRHNTLHDFILQYVGADYLRRLI